MPHIVTQNCDECRFTDCVTVCPVACFHGDERRVYIDPVACVDCGACIPACPVGAIVESNDLEDSQMSWIETNAVRAAETPVIRSKQTPLPGAEARRAVLGN
ncbi:4Fe-4S binding protein [Bradyrhizobium sp. AUGA SZCCT0176]|uniref:4Fe-4S dicluster domain-containing protein n=1 Tax=unclassified Bradyrhizobium TaxID=2631580 RepID=UPI001BA75DC6|nr:ferredoxin family protein [Bradyrhizobium sp. AUGA SZCCT0176]MBR1225160.1 4Fe-4S binding protein [Bradyrhizobium sp. AUGA SZCCT0176]MBR1281251.1 4Fe-4S binding protein [Bradyrhizobium sp. AUGA SZCCT0177]